MNILTKLRLRRHHALSEVVQAADNAASLSLRRIMVAEPYMKRMGMAHLLDGGGRVRKAGFGYLQP